MAETNPPPRLPSRRRFAGWTLLYAAIMVYASIAVSPLGFHPAGFGWDGAVQKFLGTHYWDNGSDQRADWTANLILMVPLAFMITGALWPRRSRGWRVPAAVAALLISLTYVLAVKFGQVFFPRTVSINYIIAQSTGALIGVLIFGFFHGRLAGAVQTLRQGGKRGLIVLLVAASLAAFAYTLVPFDIVVSAQDFTERMDALPHALLNLPGAGRSPAVRLALLVAAMLPALPMGMLLEAYLPRRPLGLIAITGFLAMLAMLVPALFVMSTNPALVNVPLRTIGFVAGVWFVRWIGQQHVAGLRPYLTRFAPWAVLPYLLVLLAVNGLLTTHWRGMAEAMAALTDPKRFIPLFTYYNTTKAQAMVSLVTHLAIYLPIGVLLWAAGCERRWHRWLAAVLGLVLAGCVEIGRWFQPGLVPDVNNPWVGALAAALGTMVAPLVWGLLLEMAREHQAPPRRASLARYM